MFTFTVEIQTLLGRHLVSPFSLSVAKGDKIALIGEEGNGKSVYLKSLVDTELLKDLNIKRQMSDPNIVFSYVSQEITKYDLRLSVLDYCIEEDWELYADFVREINTSLGAIDTDRPVESFSGGERVKIQLVKARLTQADCYILDEPSNDLDLESLEYLEQWMNDIQEPILFVSHDERLIQNVATRVTHFEQTHRKTRSLITVYNGTYDAYVSSRQAGIEKQHAEFDNQKRVKRKQELRWQQLYQNVNNSLRNTKGNEPEKGRLLAKKMKSVKSMKKRIDKEIIEDKRDVEESISIHFDAQERITNKRLFEFNLDELLIGDKVLGHNYHLELFAQDKIALVGRNGCGKTSFLNELQNSLTLEYGMMHQDYRKNLDFESSAIENLVIEGSVDELNRIMLRLGSLKFKESEMNAPVKHLSGGQKAKISLLKLVLQNPPLILLDEPTRNLSPLSVGEIYEMLNGYQGAIFCITHDRNLIDSVFSDALVFTDDGFLSLGGVQ